MLVLMVELLNSGIRATIDRIDWRPLKRAKDMGSAAVLLSILRDAAAPGWPSAGR
jgi:diacylglycerol kinase